MHTTSVTTLAGPWDRQSLCSVGHIECSRHRRVARICMGGAFKRYKVPGVAKSNRISCQRAEAPCSSADVIAAIGQPTLPNASRGNAPEPETAYNCAHWNGSGRARERKSSYA